MGRWALGSHHPECRAFFEAVQRNINRACVRLGLEQARSREEMNEDISDKKRDFANDPSDDELSPLASNDTLPTRTSIRNLIRRGIRIAGEIREALVPIPAPRNAMGTHKLGRAPKVQKPMTLRRANRRIAPGRSAAQLDCLMRAWRSQ